MIWRDKDDEKLLEVHQEFPFNYEKIGLILGRTSGAVRNRLNKLDIRKGEIPKHLRVCNENRSLESSNNDNSNGISLAFVNDFRRGAEGKKRKNGLVREFKVTDDYLLNLYREQQGKCYLTGLDITLPRTNKEFVSALHTASLDRIDSKKGYIPGNVAWVHKKVNIMKGKLDLSEFIQFAHLISRRNQ